MNSLSEAATIHYGSRRKNSHGFDIDANINTIGALRMRFMIRISMTRPANKSQAPKESFGISKKGHSKLYPGKWTPEV